MITFRKLMVAAIAASALAFGAVAPSTIAAAATVNNATPLPGSLVTVQWLHSHLNEVVVIDVREDMRRLTALPNVKVNEKTGKKTVIETGGHIPGALSVNFSKIRETRVVDGIKLREMMPTKEYFQKIMDDAGLNNGVAIVIAPTGDSVASLDMATRLFFQLKYFGADNVAVVNGGTNAWIAAGYPVSTDSIAAKLGNWAATTERRELLATTADVKKALPRRNVQLIDARPTAQFLGISKSSVVLAAGHVKGARSFPTDAQAKSIDGAYEFMTANDYRAIFKAEMISPVRPTIAYCNTGHFASGAWFVTHEILKNKKAKLYAGSMTEWTHLKNPVVGLPG